MLPSPLPVARVLPSGLKATEFTGAPAPGLSGVPVGWGVATSHNDTVLSLLPGGRVFPLGAEATGAAGPVRGPLTGWWVAMSHNRTLPSLLAMARVLLSGPNATELMLVWPLMRRLPIAFWVAAFHIHTVPPAPPPARVLPSGLNATELI